MVAEVDVAAPPGLAVEKRFTLRSFVGVLLLVLAFAVAPQVPRLGERLGFTTGFTELYLTSPEVAASGVRPGERVSVGVTNRFEHEDTVMVSANGREVSVLVLAAGESATVELVVPEELRVGEDLVVGVDSHDGVVSVKVR